MNSRVNLIPLSYRRRQLLKQRLRKWLGALCAMILLIAFVVVREQSRTRALASRLQNQTEQLRRVELLLKTNQTLRQKIQQHDTHPDLQAHLVRAELPLQTLGLIAEAAESTRHAVRIRSFGFQMNRKPGGKQETKQKRVLPDEDVQVTLRCLAENDADVSAFVECLRGHSVLTKVQLKSVTGQTENEQTQRQFLVECRFAAQSVILVDAEPAQRIVHMDSVEALGFNVDSKIEHKRARNR